MFEELVVGIDFGTTNCCVSIFEKDEIKIIENQYGHRITPSYLFFGDGDEIVAGTYAKKRAEIVPRNGIYEIKRLVGRKFNDPYLQDFLKRLSYEVTKDSVGDPVVIIHQSERIIGKTVTELCSLLFKNLKSFVDEKYGVSINNVVVTVPAHFRVEQRQAILQAATKAGFSVLKLLNEPTAAALCHHFEQGKSLQKASYSVVYDLGGGTFDVAILKRSLNNIEVISVDGDSQLGGHDFDNLIKDYVCNEVMANYKCDLKKDNFNMPRLDGICEDAKKALSNMKEYQLNLIGFVDGHNLITVMLTRQKFEELANDLFSKTIRIVDECLKNSKIDKQTIEEVILAGGSTRIPKIREMLTEFFEGKPLSKFMNADECVAQGAALQAAMLSKHPNQKIRNIKLIDVIPLSIGIVDFVGRMQFLIKRNTQIPASATTRFKTTFHHQSSIKLKVYEGEHLDSLKNICIATLKIDDITVAPAGECKITVKINVNESGILKIIAIEELKKKVKELKVTYTRGEKSDFEIKNQIRDAEKMNFEDEEFAKVAEAKAYLINYCNNVIKNLTTRGTADKHPSEMRMCQKYISEAKANSLGNSLPYIEHIIERVKRSCEQFFK